MGRSCAERPIVSQPADWAGTAGAVAAAAATTPAKNDESSTRLSMAAAR
jgi:hypothetical protein